MVNSLRYNTSQYGSAIPILWGQQRVSINVLEGYNYKAPPSPGKGGAVGKGKGGAQNGSVDVAFGLCIGPVDIPDGNRIWANSGVRYVNQLPLNKYFGNDGQAPDPTFLSHSPNTPVIGYSGLAYVTGTPLELSGSVLPNFSVEVNGFRFGSGASADWPSPDANPALIVYDMLYDPRVGIHFPAQSRLDIWQNFCQAAVLRFSLLCDKQQPLRSWVEELLHLTTCAGFWSSGRFVVVPYPTGQLDANDAAYYPDLTPVANLTDDDFLPWSTGTRRSPGERDPVVVTRSDASQATNWINIEILDRNYWYESAVEPPQFDQAAIELFGVRTEASVQAHEVTDPYIGATVVGYILARKSYLRNTYQFRVGWRYMLLEPMDIVTINDPVIPLQMHPVRISGVEEDELGALTIMAEDLI